MPLLEKGEIDIGFVLGEVARELFAGIGRPPTRLEVISVMYPTPGMFAVHADSRFRSIVDLRDRPVAWNSCGSGLAVQGRYVMDGLGLDAEKDFEPICTERLAEGPQMVLDGRAAALWGGGLRWPGFVTTASNARGARFVVPDAEESSRIMAKHGFLRRFTVPAGLSRPVGSDRERRLVELHHGASGSRRCGSAIASRRFCFASSARTSRRGSSAAKNTLAAVPDLGAIHPGMLRYWREQGLVP